MATVNELYKFLEDAIPAELSCDWDNDGRMVVPTPEKEVKKVLVCLDVSEGAVDYAVEIGADLILSHHPLIFNPIKNIDGQNPACRKLIKLIKKGIAVFSFHTRLDKAEGGVNDILANIMGLRYVTDFSDVGRMGEINPATFPDFARTLKGKLGADRIVCVDADRTVYRVAVVGGSGKGYLAEAAALGCDTFVTGEMPFNCEHEAAELGINLVCGGHYFTENIVCNALKELIFAFDEGIETEIFASNPSFVI